MPPVRYDRALSGSTLAAFPARTVAKGAPLQIEKAGGKGGDVRTTQTSTTGWLERRGGCGGGGGRRGLSHEP